MHQIPNSPQIFIEIKRLIESVYIDFTDDFDMFENDIFILFDPLDGIEEEDEEVEDVDDGMHDVNTSEPDFIPPNGDNEYADLIEEAIEGSADDDFDEEPDCGDDCEEQTPFNVFMPFDGKFLNHMHHNSGMPMHMMTSDEDDEPTPNFVHKPTNLKLWWKLGDDLVYASVPVKYRNLSNIVNQCIVSLGRMTETFIVRYQHWGEDGDAKM